MGLATAQDLAVLQSWSLGRSYHRNKVALLAVGQTVYQALRAFGGEPPPSANDLEEPFAAALRVNSAFKAICAGKGHANPGLHAVFARALARYILDFEWQAITST